MHDYIEGFRLSRLQARVWGGRQNNSTYCAQCEISISGKLDKIALNAALQQVVRRHEVLRTSFHELPGMEAPLQVVAKFANPSVKEVDLTEVGPRERETRVDRLIWEEKNLSLNFEGPSLLQVCLIKLTSKTHVLLLTLPTLCADAKTLNNLMLEIARCYDFCVRGQEADSEAVSYIQYAEWQNEFLEGENAISGRDFWNNRGLSNGSALKLPFRSESRKTEENMLQTHSVVIDSDLTALLGSIERKYGILKKEFLLACWQTTLWKLTAQREITIGYECDGRRYDELQGALGLFTRTLPVSCQFDKADTFDEVLTQISQYLRDCYKWQECFSWPESNGNSAKENFFQIGFEYFEYAEPLRAGDVSFSMMRQTVFVDRYRLKLKCEMRGEELRAEFSYEATMYERGAIERLADQYLTVVASAARRPDQRLDELSMISAREREMQLHEWNQTEVVWEAPQSIAEWFESQVERAPERVAIEFGHEWITYRELNERANHLAWRLKDHGVGPDVAVAILIERSFEMVISLLGVMKAGGAYVPLDANYPKQRLSYMVKDARARVVLTEEKLLEALPETEADVICVDRERSVIDSRRADNPGVRLEVENLAYVIYTSGSTGQPKGAMITQRGLRNYLKWSIQEYRVGEGEGSLLHSSLGFDLTVTALYPPLLTGRRLILVKESEGISELSSALRRCDSLSLVKLTPSHLEVLNQWIPIEELSGRTNSLVIGGEALHGERLRQWQSYAPETRLINEYGPTETVVGCCVYEVKARDEIAGAVPIGCPISNTKIYIFNEKQELVGVGESGELYIGGEGVCRGYVGRADQTAEKFTPNPYSEVEGERFYRTGDLARYLWDGEIEYLGRRDQQVKVKGYRIELGEIEETLVRHEQVGAAAVVLRDEKGERRIVAYVSEKRGSGAEVRITSRELRAYLKDRLPDFMVPERIVMLEEMPLTANGKIDRGALPETGKMRPDSEGAYVAPRSYEEEVLATIWAEVLDLEQIGIYDNFFAIGGDSIRSVKVVALANEKGFNFTVEDIFQHQTIADLSKGSPLSESQGSPVIRTEPFGLIDQVDRERLPTDIEDAYPLTMMQAGMYYHLELTPHSPSYHNINSFHMRGKFGATEMQEAVRQIVARHAALRTSFDFTSYSQPLQLTHKTAFLPVVVKDLRGLSYKEQEEALEAFVENERRRPFDLSSPPLMRIHVHLRSEDTFQFSLTELHLVADGWSTTSMFAEILNRMTALLNHEPLPDLAPPSTSFRDYVAMELAALQSREFQRFWETKLQDCAPTRIPRWSVSARANKFFEAADEEPLNVSQLFKWPTRGAGNTRQQRLDFPVRNEIVDGLKRLARTATVPLKSAFLAAHVKVMSILSGQSDILIGLSANGRPEVPDGIDVRGLFLNTLPFRLNLSNGSWLQLVKETFEAEREALPFRRYPMAALQQAYGQETLIDTLFGYLHFHAAEGALDSNKVELLDHGNIDWSETNFTFSAVFHKGPFPASFPYEFMLTMFYEIESFCAEQARGIYGYYDRVLEAMVSEPHSQHQAQSFLSNRDQTRLLIEWNDTRADYPRERTVHRLFEAQVEQSPEAVAITCGDEQLTYRELNARANRLAHHLCELGVDLGARVAIFLGRSVNLVVAQLATLKCGAAYLPIDSTFPEERQMFMVTDCAATVAISTRSAFLPEGLTAVRVNIDDFEPATETIDNLNLPSNSEMTAYVMYTSGSTGQPKGVMAPHRAVTRLVLNCGYADFDAADRVAFAANPAFDASTMEVWAPLLNGGRIVVIDREALLEPKSFARLLEQQGVTALFLTTAIFNQYALAIPEALSRLRFLFCGGERNEPSSFARVLERSGPAHLIHCYGPTETTTFAITREVTEVPEGIRSIPLGRPISNTRIYILDANRQPVPIGVAGELYIGGAGVAHGYLNRPDLTQERFLPDPFSQESGARMYKTGDLGRWLPNGEIEFEGRNDFQVKIRGFRIELGEIEVALASCPGVQEVLALAHEDSEGGKRLVVYYTGEEIGAEALRGHLSPMLPDYMIPSAYVYLETLPLTPNGKIDRKALPVPADQAYVTHGYDPPVGEAEIQLAQIWSSLLNLEKVGRHDNFFELGGHSLMANLLVNQIRQEMAVDIALTDVFNNSDLASLAECIVTAQLAQYDADDLAQVIAALDAS